MPEELERELLARARSKGYSKKRTGAYVYGTLRKTGWKPEREKNSGIAREVERRSARKRNLKNY